MKTKRGSLQQTQGDSESAEGDRGIDPDDIVDSMRVFIFIREDSHRGVLGRSRHDSQQDDRPPPIRKLQGGSCRKYKGLPTELERDGCGVGRQPAGNSDLTLRIRPVSNDEPFHTADCDGRLPDLEPGATRNRRPGRFRHLAQSALSRAVVCERFIDEGHQTLENPHGTTEAHGRH